MFPDDAFEYAQVAAKTIPAAKSVNEPYSPADAAAAKTSAIPPVVFAVINELLATHVSNGRATFKQSDIIEGVRTRTGEPFQHQWLSFADVYKARGWHVSSDIPGYNESYPAMYTFSDASRWAS
jgi:hypothetical protein